MRAEDTLTLILQAALVAGVVWFMLDCFLIPDAKLLWRRILRRWRANRGEPQ